MQLIAITDSDAVLDTGVHKIEMLFTILRLRRFDSDSILPVPTNSHRRRTRPRNRIRPRRVCFPRHRPTVRNNDILILERSPRWQADSTIPRRVLGSVSHRRELDSIRSVPRPKLRDGTRQLDGVAEVGCFPADEGDSDGGRGRTWRARRSGAGRGDERGC